MSKFLLVFSLLFGGSLSAQKAFYIRPTAMMKTSNGFYLGHSIFRSMSALNFVENDYYTFYNYGHHFSNSKINLGLGLGIKFSTEKSLELFISADGSSVQQSNLFYNSGNFNDVLVKKPDMDKFLWGRALIRGNIEYHQCFLKKNAFDLSGVLGLGIFVTQYKNIEIFYNAFGNDDFTAISKNTNINPNRVSPLLLFGFEMNFKTKKDVPLFSLGITTSLNLWKRLQYVTYEVSVLDHNTGATHNYFHSLFSRGSGINFQLSRPIQVYPWRPNKKPKTAL